MTDSLFRISLKAYIENDKGEVLVVKERGRDWWDLPGGGMEYGENIKEALARELKEEVGYEGEFSYDVIGVDEPRFLLREIWQVRLIFNVTPETFTFSFGEDGDDMAFMNPNEFEQSESGAERLTCYYGRKLKGDMSYDPKMPKRETTRGR